MRVTETVFREASARVSDPVIRQALLLDPYWGFDTNGGMNQRGQKKSALRQAEVIPDDEDEQIRKGRHGRNPAGAAA